MKINLSKNKIDNIIYNSVIFLLIWVVFQDFILPIFYTATSSSLITKIIFFSKDFIFVVLSMITILRIKRLNIKLIIIYAVFFIILIIQAIVSLFNDISYMNIFSSFRGWLLFPMVVLIGYYIPNKKKFYKFITTKYFIILIFCAIVGVIEFYLDKTIGTKIFWTDFIHLDNFMADIKGQGNRLWERLPGSFYGSYGGSFFSQKRLISFWASPLTAAYVLIIPTIYYFIKIMRFEKFNYKNILIFMILFISIFLTYTRAIILPMLIMISIIYTIYARKRILIPIAIIGLLVIGIFKYDSIHSYIYDGSTMEHIRQFLDGIRNIKIFGSGLGTFGINSDIGTESTYVSLLGQMGIIALFIYCGAFVYIMIRLYKKFNQNIIIATMLFCAGIYSFTGIISEQLFAFTSIFPFYVVLGFSLSINKEDLLEAETFENTNESKAKKVLFLNSICPTNKSGGSKMEQRNFAFMKEYFEVSSVGIYTKKRTIIFKIIDYFLSPVSVLYSIWDYFKIIRIIDKTDANVLFIDGSLMGLFAHYAKNKGMKVVVFFQNCEKVLFEGTRKPLFKNNAIKQEKLSIQYADHLIFLNDRDYKEIVKQYNYTKSNYSILPVSLKDELNKEDLTHKLETSKLLNGLFVGSLFKPNEEAVKYIIDHIADNIDCEILVVGQDFELFQYKNKENVKIIGTIDSLKEYYLNADFMIFPIFEGSGMKVKTCDALMYGKTILATKEAFEGYDIKDLKNCHVCNTPEEFIDKINYLKISGNMRFNNDVRNRYEEKYEYNVCKEKMHAIINSVL